MSGWGSLEESSLLFVQQNVGCHNSSHSRHLEIQTSPSVTESCSQDCQLVPMGRSVLQMGKYSVMPMASFPFPEYFAMTTVKPAMAMAKFSAMPMAMYFATPRAMYSAMVLVSFPAARSLCLVKPWVNSNYLSLVARVFWTDPAPPADTTAGLRHRPGPAPWAAQQAPASVGRGHGHGRLCHCLCLSGECEEVEVGRPWRSCPLQRPGKTITPKYCRILRECFQHSNVDRNYQNTLFVIFSPNTTLHVLQSLP